MTCIRPAVWRKRAISCALLLLAAWLAPEPVSAGTPQIWFAGVDPVVRQDRKQDQNDYSKLFDADARWPVASSRLQVLEVSTQFITRARQDQLQQVIDSLKAQRVSLAVSGLVLTGTSRCGIGVEGYTGPGDMELTANRILKLGGRLDYVTMDEPLFYGHLFSGRKACNDSIESVAQQVAANIGVIRRLHPNVKIGDDEPLIVRDGVDWVAMLNDWFKAYRSASGEPLAFLHADVNWRSGRWQAELGKLASMTRASNVPFGVIYNGDPSAKSDSDWTTQAEERFHLVESRLGIQPDHAVIQTWMSRPSRMLPEDEPGTMTYLLRRYIESRGAR